jgi:hypothetical protein
MYTANQLNLDVSNHDRIIVTLSEAPSSGSIGVGIYQVGGHFSYIFSPQTLSGAGEYTFMMSYLDNYVDYQNVEGIRLYFTGMPAYSTIRVDSMVIRSQPCPAGKYDNGSGCVPADPGYYVPDSGATEQFACPAGTYQPNAGSISCEPAPAGSYVALEGQIEATACTPGKYQPYTGSVSCILADPGYYVDSSSAIEQIMCLAGYTSEAGAVACYPINTSPTADAGGPYLVAVNTSINFDGSGSTDPEGDTLTETWSSDGGAVSGNTFTAGSEAGIYGVCLTVNDGLLDSEPSCTMVVIYDPSAGFVTGGGWIASPAGAYKDDESLSGKATFGFVSKYKKGANVPTGNTEFQFQAAGFNFHSENYEWLVVNQGGTSAQFKGEGTINGALDTNGNAYKFMLWAGDNTPDTLRIKIWWEDNTGEHVVYDNGTDQEIGGGSIVVHTGK